MQPYLAFSVSRPNGFVFPLQAQVEHERKALDLLTNLEVRSLFVVKIIDLFSLFFFSVFGLFCFSTFGTCCKPMNSNPKAFCFPKL